MAAMLALFSGFSIVLNRVLNAEAGVRIGVTQSTVFNYITGLLVSLAALFIAREPFIPPSFENPMLFTGGLMGVCVIWLSNYAAPRLSVFLMTLIVFVSQFVTALCIDAFAGTPLSLLKALGGLCVLVGLVLYVLGEKKEVEADA